jgi:hypothetical protein
MITWLKKLALGNLIRSMDDLEPVIADKIREGQEKAASIPPEQFAKELVDSVQAKLCQYAGLDPKEILK